MTLETNSKDRKVSLHGKVLGIDYDGQLVGPPGNRQAYEVLTTSSVAMARSGLTVINSTEALDFTLAAPLSIGSEKTIVDASTYANTVNRSTEEGPCSFYFSTGTDQEGQKMTFGASLRCSVQLIAITTDQWAPMNPGSTLYVAVSTST